MTIKILEFRPICDIFIDLLSDLTFQLLLYQLYPIPFFKFYELKLSSQLKSLNFDLFATYLSTYYPI